MASVQLDGRFDEPNSNVNEWIRFAMKLGVQSVLHPFEYSKVLIQVRTAARKLCLLLRDDIRWTLSTSSKAMISNREK